MLVCVAQMRFTSQMSMNFLATRGLMRDRSCGPCDVSSGSKRLRSDDRSPQSHKRRAFLRYDCTYESGESLGE